MLNADCCLHMITSYDSFFRVYNHEDADKGDDDDDDDDGGDKNDDAEYLLGTTR